MIINELQSHPFHPLYEAICSNTEIHQLIDWLSKDDLPNNMSLSLGHGMYVFRTKLERISFALGLQASTHDWKESE